MRVFYTSSKHELCVSSLYFHLNQISHHHFKLFSSNAIGAMKQQRKKNYEGSAEE